MEYILGILFFMGLTFFYFKIRKWKRKKLKMSFIDVEGMPYKEVRRKYKILRKFNSEFYSALGSWEKLDNQYKEILSSYPKKISDSSSQVEKEYLTYKNQNVEKQSLKKIKEILRYIELAERQIKYFKGQIEKVEKAKKLLKVRKYGKEFFNLQKERMSFLKTLNRVLSEAIKAIEDDIHKFNEAITELEKNKKEHLLVRGLVAGGKIITAPIRHAYNIIDGAATGDRKRAGKGIFMLAAGLVGVGIAADALDLFEAGEAIDSADSERHFVEPHERILPSGETIWVDGDGDTSVNLTRAEGGGYWRS